MPNGDEARARAEAEIERRSHSMADNMPGYNRSIIAELPVPLVLAAFDRGVLPAAIAEGFGCDAVDVVQVVTLALRDRGLSDDEIAEAFATVWGLT